MYLFLFLLLILVLLLVAAVVVLAILQIESWASHMVGKHFTYKLWSLYPQISLFLILYLCVCAHMCVRVCVCLCMCLQVWFGDWNETCPPRFRHLTACSLVGGTVWEVAPPCWRKSITEDGPWESQPQSPSTVLSLLCGSCLRCVFGVLCYWSHTCCLMSRGTCISLVPFAKVTPSFSKLPWS